MKRIPIQPLFRRPKTSKPAHGHKVFPNLLRKLAVTQPNHVWVMDITCIPITRRFFFPVAALDWYSRMVLASRQSTTLETGPPVH